MIIERPLLGTVDVQALDGGTWQTWIIDATGIRIRRGGTRDGLGVRVDVGLLSFTLKDVQDPLAGGTFYPGQTIRALADGDELFTGRIAHFESVYPLNKRTGESMALTTVTVADAVQIHGSTIRYGVWLGDDLFETFEARIQRLAGSANAPVAAPAVGDPIVRYAL